jgi:hypothetical protein
MGLSKPLFPFFCPPFHLASTHLAHFFAPLQISLSGTFGLSTLQHFNPAVKRSKLRSQADSPNTWCHCGYFLIPADPTKQSLLYILTRHSQEWRLRFEVDISVQITFLNVSVIKGKVIQYVVFKECHQLGRIDQYMGQGSDVLQSNLSNLLFAFGNSLWRRHFLSQKKKYYCPNMWSQACPKKSVARQR